MIRTLRIICCIAAGFLVAPFGWRGIALTLVGVAYVNLVCMERD